MKISQLAEEITVTGESAVVDTQTNQVSTNYDEEWVRNAPIPRFTFFDLINAAPGVNQAQTGDSRSTSLGISHHRQLVPARRHRLHGAVHGRSLALAEHRRDRGGRGPLARRDRRVRQPAGRGLQRRDAPGRATRSTATRTSTSRRQSLTARNTTDEQDGGLPYHRDQYNDATCQLGGPILKDKLWFFGSYQYQRDWESPAGSPRSSRRSSEADRVFGKLNYQINAKNKLMFAYHDDYYRIPCAVDCNAFTAPSAIKSRTATTRRPT